MPLIKVYNEYKAFNAWPAKVSIPRLNEPPVLIIDRKK